MQAIVLAGGFGTRLQSVVSDLPKPMAPINDKPFLVYIMNQLKKAGFTKVVLAVGYKKECIIDYFGNTYLGMDVVYSNEDQPLGTGGAIKKAFSLIDEEYAFIVNGDTYFNIDFRKLMIDKDVVIACKYMKDFDRYGKVEISNGRIVEFQEKKHNDEGYINGGIYYFKKDVFSRYDLEEKFSLEKDLFEKYINQIEIYASCSDDYFIDIGIPQDYFKAQEDFKNE